MDLYNGDWGMAVSFGAATLCFASLVLALDRTQLLVDQFSYTTAWQGRLEGCVLLTLSAYWIIGVAYLTQVQGIAYTVLNVYFSAWLCLAAALYTLNHWSTKQDILSWAEMTSVSATLKSWYILWLASLVVLGTSINYYYFLRNQHDKFFLFPPAEEDQRGASIIGMVLGTGSSLVSLAFILIHYRLIQPCGTGGWTELAGALFVTLCWIVGCAVLTQEGAIGATIVGRGCASKFWTLLQQQYEEEWVGGSGSDDDRADVTANLWYWVRRTIENDGASSSTACQVQVLTSDMRDTNTTTSIRLVNVTVPCDSLAETTVPTVDYVPGSNFYLSVWTCMAASIHLLLRWKAQQALQFAQAQQANRMRGRNDKDGSFAPAVAVDDDDDDDLDENGDGSGFLGDEDDDLDEFEDAAND